MIRQPVSVGGSGGGADYESFEIRVAGDLDTSFARYGVNLSYYSPDGTYHPRAEYEAGTKLTCRANSVYVDCVQTHGPTSGDYYYVNPSLENGVLILTVTNG